jgi:hypothetical protein
MDDRPTTWPEYEYQLSTGSYGGLDDRVKTRKRKQPIGFAPPKPKPKPKTRRKP